jgi:long-chain acyl-CoA synthetase
MNKMPTQTIPAKLKRNGTDPAYKNKPGYFVRENNIWVPTTFEDYYQETLQAAKALFSLGIPVDGKVCILAFNRPEWVIADLAAMMIGGVPAGIYQTCSPEEVQYIIHHSESKVVFVENKEQWEKVKKEEENLPLLEKIVLMRGTTIEDERTLNWEDFLALGNDVSSETVFERLDNIDANAPATFIYTSGTTGPPKAVMLSHDNLTFTADTAVEMINFQSTDSSVSYLPLSHIAEQMFSIHAPITVGSSIYFAESIDKLPDNLKEVQPTVIFGVPRIWEKFHAGVNKKLAEATGLKAKIVNWSIAVGSEKNALQNQGRSISLRMKLKYAIANKLIFSKLKPAIGLGNARVCVSGAAPIAAEILEFFSGLDLIIHEVYGQSEDCGPTTFNLPGKTKYGSVGPAVPGVQVKFAEGNEKDGREIIVKGRNVFLGYYKDKEATDSTLIDGWLYSGDLGKVDKDGFFHIVGRKKEIIITAGGKNIAPKNIEAALKNLPLISQAVVIGDRRKFLSALVTLDEEEAASWAEKNDIANSSLSNDEQLKSYLDKQIKNEVNQKFAKVEHIRKFTILPRELSIDEGELTPTLKIKRRIVNSNWAEIIDSMYE